MPFKRRAFYLPPQGYGQKISIINEYSSLLKYLSNFEVFILSDICKQCAACCQRYPFIELSQKEIFSLKEATGIHPDLFTNRKDDENDEYFLQFKENGFCYFLFEQDNTFSCSVYAARPGICKNYPSDPLQQAVCNANNLRLQLNDSKAASMECDSNH